MRQNLMRFKPARSAACAALVAALLGLAASASAQYRTYPGQDGVPAPGPNPEVADRPNAMLPQGLEFTRSDGKKIKLGELLDVKKPLIMQLVYFSCPSLCGVAQDHLVEAVKGDLRGLQIGEDFDVVVVSIDPDDTSADAAAKRQKYLQLAGKPPSQKGFTYLTGSQENIAILADTVGFGFKRNFDSVPGDSAGKFAHSAGTFIFTPGGKLSQTIRNVDYPADKLHFALVEASAGKIGHGFLTQIGLPCGAVRLNPETGRYEHNPWFWAGTAGGGASLAFVALFLGMMWRGEWKKSRELGKAAEGTTEGKTILGKTTEGTEHRDDVI